MKFREIKTGRIVDFPCEIKSIFWEKVEGGEDSALSSPVAEKKEVKKPARKKTK
jgi:hypothetical protein